MKKERKKATQKDTPCKALSRLIEPYGEPPDSEFLFGMRLKSIGSHCDDDLLMMLIIVMKSK